MWSTITATTPARVSKRLTHLSSLHRQRQQAALATRSIVVAAAAAVTTSATPRLLFSSSSSSSSSSGENFSSSSSSDDDAVYPTSPPAPAPSSSSSWVGETTTQTNQHQPPIWSDPAIRQYKFWNREEHAKYANKYSFLIEISPESIQQEARIISLEDTSIDNANEALHKPSNLPIGASLIGTGTTIDDFRSNSTTATTTTASSSSSSVVVGGSSSSSSSPSNRQPPNVLYISPSCPNASKVLPEVLNAYPSIEWIHCRSAGIDFIVSDELCELCNRRNIRITNAKGQFSSTLAEYVFFAFSYFAKDLPRLLKQKQNKQWLKYNVHELRGKTLGIVGYGDIGRSVAKLASIYGMKIIALRRHPYLSKYDPLCNIVYGRDKSSLQKLMKQSDYIVCSAPSTIETRGMINAEAFDSVKDGAIFVNLGRGPVIDEDALIRSLKKPNGTGLAGAALDVFSMEPLSSDSELWTLENTLISPHNMDQTSTFMHEATEFFINENLPRFLCNEDLLNPVDPNLGY